MCLLPRNIGNLINTWFGSDRKVRYTVMEKLVTCILKSYITNLDTGQQQKVGGRSEYRSLGCLLFWPGLLIRFSLYQESLNTT